MSMFLRARMNDLELPVRAVLEPGDPYFWTLVDASGRLIFRHVVPNAGEKDTARIAALVNAQKPAEPEPGWACPRCMTCYSPDVAHCPTCIEHFRKQCVYCSVSFYPKRWDQVYCGKNCRNASYAKGKRRDYVRIARGVIERTCERAGCGFSFTVYHRAQKFCSVKCQHTDRNDRARQRRVEFNKRYRL